MMYENSSVLSMAEVELRKFFGVVVSVGLQVVGEIHMHEVIEYFNINL